MADPVTDSLIAWLRDADSTDLNTPQGGSTMAPGSATELAGELRRIKSEVRAQSLNQSWERWAGQYGTLTYVSASSFTLTGDQRVSAGGPIEITRRCKCTVTAGTVYNVIIDVSFGGGLTTVTVSPGNLDSGLSEVQFGIPMTGTPSAFAVPGVRVYRSTNQSLTSGTATAIIFDTVRYNNFGNYLYNGGVAPTRVKYPFAFPGLCRLSGGINWAANTAGDRIAAIAINSDFTNTIAVSRVSAAGGSGIIGQNVSTEWIMQPGDYAELVGDQTSGGALDVAANLQSSPELALTFITARP